MFNRILCTNTIKSSYKNLTPTEVSYLGNSIISLWFMALNTVTPKKESVKSKSQIDDSQMP